MTTCKIIPLEYDGPAGVGLSMLDLDAADFESDLPEQHWHLYHENMPLNLIVGVWTTTSMQEKFGPYPGDEFMCILEGQVEMIDRFGLLPDATRNLFEIAALRLRAESIGVTRIDLGPRGGRLEFGEGATADPRALVRLIQDQPADYRLAGPSKLLIMTEEEDGARRITHAGKLLDALTTPDER